MTRSFAPQLALAALLSLGLAAGCQPAADKTADTTAATAAEATPITHAELVADHQKMESDHRIMQTADSVMEVDHRQALANAKAAGILNTPASKPWKSATMPSVSSTRTRLSATMP